jgi:hypothetical protein
MKKLIILLSLSLLMIRCSDSLTNYNEVVLGKEFDLKVGDSAVLADQGLIIKFKSVNYYSRCPTGAICVWEGNAKVVLELKNSEGDTLTAKLNTSLEPRAVEFANITIELKNLSPYPKVDEIINPKDYVASLLVKNKEN